MSTNTRSLSPLPARLGYGFVILSLLALVVVPVLLDRRIDGLRDRLDIALDPARTLVTEAQFMLARSMSALRGYMISGEPRFLERLDRAARRETQLLAELDQVTDELGVDVAERLTELRTLTRRWRADLAAADTGAPGLAERELALYEETLTAASALDRTLAEEAQQVRTRIRELERLSLVITVVLALLALASAVIVGRFSAQVRRLAREARHRTAQAEAALAQLRASIEARERLLRGLTHDLKNPLSAAAAYAELLESGLHGAVNREQEQTLRSIHRLIHTSTRLIDDLLQLAQAERGELRLTKQSVDVIALVRETVDAYRTAIETSGRRLAEQLPDARVIVATDAGRARQVLENLLSNALKYSPPGGHVQVAAQSADGHVVLSVSDDGPGIPADERERVFEEFYRLPGSEGTGHGLGLAISRQIARLLGGDLWAEAPAHGGTRFMFVLPVADDDGGETRKHRSGKGEDAPAAMPASDQNRPLGPLVPPRAPRRAPSDRRRSPSP